MTSFERFKHSLDRAIEFSAKTNKQAYESLCALISADGKRVDAMTYLVSENPNDFHPKDLSSLRAELKSGIILSGFTESSKVKCRVGVPTRNYDDSVSYLSIMQELRYLCFML